MSAKTIFGYFRQPASAVYRVTTESSVYIVGFHKDGARRYVVVRGLAGTDREHVVLRDSDPRVGPASMFELSPWEWIGHTMEIATMTSSPITAAVIETERAAIASVGGESPSAHAAWKHTASPQEPAWTPAVQVTREQPRNNVRFGSGTAPMIDGAALRGVGYDVVVGQQARAATATPAHEVPYPRRHVVYAENVATLLRSISRRDRLFEDVANDRDLKDRLRRSLDDCAELLEQIRRRDRR